MKNIVNYGDFEKLDIRAGKIVSASAPEWSVKLLRFEIDFGEELGEKVLFSGIAKWYSAEDLVGKTVPVVVNMEPKKMGDEESCGMIIMADGDEQPALFFLGDNIVPGTVIR